MPPRKTKEPAEAPVYIDGFNWKTIVGAMFVGLVMMPASIYIGLFSGTGIASAAEWVTIILFAELARRSISALKKQEMYLLYHVAGSLAGGAMIAGVGGGGVFTMLIWHQFLRQSREAAAFGLAQGMPWWAAPAADSPAILERALWHADWWPVIGLVLLGQILGKLNWFGLGYALFRITNDVERLPFPLATIAAEGAVALAEAPEKKDSWRWRAFSLGSMIGLGFGIIYIGLPSVTGLIFTRPMYLLPIPFMDFTADIEGVLPSAMLNVSFDMGLLFIGMVIPFWVVIGQTAMTLLTALAGNPILHKLGLLPTWQPGMNVLATNLAARMDFWLSVGVGGALAVATVGFYHFFKAMRARRKPGGGGQDVKDMDILVGKEGGFYVGRTTEKSSWTPPKGRGDWPLWLALIMFFVSTSGYVSLCKWLVPGFPLIMLIFYGFVWTPLNSYISARMIGLTGSGVGFPMVKEASFILSGYKGVDIWFAPIPLQDLGYGAAFFKQSDLTRTKFTSLIKAELLMLPINIVCSFVFWAFIWHLMAIPSYSFPWTDKMWPFEAIGFGLFSTATGEGRQWLLEALKLKVIVGGYIGGITLFSLVSALNWPVFFFYGAMGGIGVRPEPVFLLLLGALLGRFYFSKKLGQELWFRYIPVITAGYFAGVGLIGMLAVGITMVTGSVVTKPF